MAEDTRYNGWRNYETWAVGLWLDNEEPSYNYWREEAERAYKDAEPDNYFSRKERACLDLEAQLKDEHAEAMPELEGIWADLLTSAFGEVDWYEIAEHMIDDYLADNPDTGDDDEEQEA